MKKLFLLLFCTGLVYTQNIKEVTILHWNDFHARNEPYKISKKDNATGETIYYLVGGTGSMLGYMNKYRTPESLVLNAGDDFQGTPISNFTRGGSQIELMNLFNPDAFTVGNHEFDYSQYSLDSVLKFAKFDVLSANVWLSYRNSLLGKPYVVKEKNGVKFGIIGITLPELSEVTLPKNIENVVMLNTDSVIAAGITELKNEKCNVIILLTHCGVDEDKIFADKFYKDVDIIVGGHSHTPLFKPKRENGVIIVQAGSYARWLGKLDIKVDVDKDTVVEAYENLVETVMDSSIFDRSAANKVADMISAYAPQLKRVIGRLESDWKSGYSTETNLGQFQADAFRQKTNADVSFMNGGGIRKGLYKGDITEGDIWEISPFGNEIFVYNVTGKTLRQMVKNNIMIRIEKIKKGEGAEILEVSGLNYSYDSVKAAEGSTEFLISINIGRAEVQDDMVYKIASNSFIYSQFKKFFGEVDEKVEGNSTGLIDRDLIIQAVEELKVINTVVEKRIVNVSKE